MLYTKNYKFSAFGDFDRIQPTPETVNQLLQAFSSKGFVPSIANELRVNPDNPQENVAVRRVVLANTNNDQNIAILGNRIDFEFKYDQDFIMNPEDFDSLQKSIVEAYAYLFKNYSMNSNRLAVNIDCYAIPIENQYAKVLSEFKTPVDFFNEEKFTDYRMRALVRKDLVLNKDKETCNVIADISLGDFSKLEKNEIKQMKGFIVHSDINTLGENILYRFNADNIRPFITQAFEWWQLSMKGLY